MSDYLVTIKLRVQVDDDAALLDAWRATDPETARELAGERVLSLCGALQAFVRPPDLSGLPGAGPARGAVPLASVQAEPWPDTDEDW